MYFILALNKSCLLTYLTISSLMIYGQNATVKKYLTKDNAMSLNLYSDSSYKAVFKQTKIFKLRIEEGKYTQVNTTSIKLFPKKVDGISIDQTVDTIYKLDKTSICLYTDNGLLYIDELANAQVKDSLNIYFSSIELFKCKTVNLLKITPIFLVTEDFRIPFNLIPNYRLEVTFKNTFEIFRTRIQNLSKLRALKLTPPTHRRSNIL